MVRVGLLGRVGGIWPELRVVRRERRGVRMPITRMVVVVVFAVVELQKVVGVHLGRGEGGKESPKVLDSDWRARRETGESKRVIICCM